jgi:large subunit ribosomal protein L19e
MTDLSVQKRLASNIMKCSPKKVKFDTDSLAEIKESITKGDIKSLIAKGIISTRFMHGNSRVRARSILIQKRKGLRKGHGSRKGSPNARSNQKLEWINRIRKLRVLLKKLRDGNLIATKDYHMLCNKAKGGFFRSERHIKIYLEENQLVHKNKQ